MAWPMALPPDRNGVPRRSPDTVAVLPVGTIIVKTIEDTYTDEITQVHAMSKRVEDYNEDGALGWEWFELQLDEDARPVIIWRGTHPPDGECYHCPPGTDPEKAAMLGDCNICHAGAGVDSVQTLPMWF